MKRRLQRLFESDDFWIGFNVGATIIMVLGLVWMFATFGIDTSHVNFGIL